MSSKRQSRKPFDRVRHRAKELRKMQTPAEVALWARLRNRQLNGMKFRRQHPIGPYIVDFYCAGKRLVVELDGGIHRNQADYDAERTAYLASMGCQMLRVNNVELESDLEAVLGKIAEACGTQSLLPGLGEGRSDIRPPEPRSLRG